MPTRAGLLSCLGSGSLCCGGLCCLCCGGLCCLCCRSLCNGLCCGSSGCCRSLIGSGSDCSGCLSGRSYCLEHHCTHNTLGDACNTVDLRRKICGCIKGNKRIVTVVLIVDRICKSALAPIIDANDLTALLDHSLKLFNNGFYTLVTDIEINNEKCFVRRKLSFHKYTSLWT